MGLRAYQPRKLDDLQSEMNRRFVELRADVERRADEIRQDRDLNTKIAREMPSTAFTNCVSK